MSRLLKVDENSLLDTRTAVAHHLSKTYNYDYEDTFKGYESVTKHIGLSGNPIQDYKTLNAEIQELPENFNQRARNISQANFGTGQEFFNALYKGASSRGLLSATEGLARMTGAGGAQLRENDKRIEEAFQDHPVLGNLEGGTIRRILMPGSGPYAYAAGQMEPIVKYGDFEGIADRIQQMREEIETKYFNTASFEESKFGQITSGLGQAAGLLPGMFIPYVGPAATVAAGVGMSYDQGYYDYVDTMEAMGKEVNLADAHQAAVFNLPTAAVSIISDRLLVGRILKSSIGQPIRNLSKGAGKSFVFGGLEEGTQEFWTNVSAKYLAGYDQDREITQGVVDAIIVGAFVDTGAFSVGKTLKKVTDTFIMRDGSGKMSDLKAMNKTLGGQENVERAVLVSTGDADFAELIAAASTGDRQAYQKLQEYLLSQGEGESMLNEEDSASLEDLDEQNFKEQTQEQKQEQARLVMDNAVSSAIDLINQTLPENQQIVHKKNRERTLADQITEMQQQGMLQTDEEVQGYVNEVLSAARIDNSDVDFDPSDIQIRGRSIVIKSKDGFLNDVAIVYKGADLTTPFEEVAESFMKRQLREGKISREKLRTWKEQYENEYGKTHGNGDRDLIEWFSTLATGRALANKGMNKGLRATIQRFLKYFESVLEVGGNLKVLEKKGLIEQDFFTALDQSTGLVERDQDAESVVDPDQDVDDDTFQMEVRVTASENANLKSFSKGEINKRVKNAKWFHLAQVVRDTSKAYGVEIVTNQPTIEAYKPGGEAQFDVPQTIIIKTDDPVLGKEIATMIAVQSPTHQKSAFVISPNPDGESIQYSFKVKSTKLGLEVASEMEQMLFQKNEAGEFELDGEGDRIPLTGGFSFDPETRIFSINVINADPDLESELQNYVEQQKADKRISIGESLQSTRIDIQATSEAEYESVVEQARKRFSQEPGTGGGSELVARAQRKLTRHSEALKTAEKARTLLAARKAPPESVESLLDNLPSDLEDGKFANIRALADFLDQRFKGRHKANRYLNPGDITEVRAQINKLNKTKKAREQNADQIAALEDKIKSIKTKIARGKNNAVKNMVYDILYSLSRSGSGQGWYDSTVSETISELQKLFPELNNKGDMAVFIGILASTSQGETVTNNFNYAYYIYKDYKRNGRFRPFTKGEAVATDPETGKEVKLGKSAEPISENLAIIQKTIDTYGVEGFANMMDSQFTGRELMTQFDLSEKPTGVNLDDVVKGNRVFGPKIGSFFNNLQRDFTTITMDLWYTRTMHRYTGETAAPVDSKKFQKYIQTFKDALNARLAETPTGDNLFGRTYGLESLDNATDQEVIRAAMDVFLGWSTGKLYDVEGYALFRDPDTVVEEKLRVKGKKQIVKVGKRLMDLEYAARNIQTNAGMKGDPQNKSFRLYFEDIITDAQTELRNLGIDLNAADIQAILWYAEKRFFVATGTANSASAPADYLDAAMKTRYKQEPDTFQISRPTEEVWTTEADQEISSADTSINETKLPSIFNPSGKYRSILFQEGNVILDLGGGRFDNAVEEAAAAGAKLFVHDIYNRTQEHNDAVVEKVKNGNADFVTVNNVLNVIAEPEARALVMQQAANAVAPGGKIFVQIYEGDSKNRGEPGPTIKGFQNNMATKDYVPEIESVLEGYKIERKGNVIEITDPGVPMSEIQKDLKIEAGDTFQIDAGDREMLLDDDLTAEEVVFEKSYGARMEEEKKFRKRISQLKASIQRVAFELDPGLKPGADLPPQLAALVPESLTPLGAKARKYNQLMEELSQVQTEYRNSQVLGEKTFQQAKASRAKKKVQVQALIRLEKEVQKRFAKIKQLKEDRENTVDAIRELEVLVATLPTPVRGRFVGFRKLANMKTEAGRQRYLETAEARIQSIFNQYLYQERRGQLKDVLKGYKNRRATKLRKLSAKFGKEARDKILYAYEMAFFDGDPELAPIPPQGMAEEDAQTIEAIFQGVMIPGADTNRIASAFNYIKDVESNGRAEIDQFNRRRSQRNEELREATKEAILKGDSERSAQEQALENDKQKTIAGRFVKAMRFFTQGQYGLEQLIEIMDNAKVAYGGVMNKLLFEPTFEADQREQNLTREDLESFQLAVTEIFSGQKPTVVAKIIKNFRNKVNDTGIFFDQGTGVKEQPMSVMQAISMYNALKDPTLQKTFEGMSVDGKTIKAIEEFIGPEGIALADFFMQAYKAKGLEVQAAHRVTEGFEMDLVENYSGRLIRVGAADPTDTGTLASTIDLAGQQGSKRPSVKNGSLKARQGSTLPLLFNDADTEFMRHTTEMNHYIAFAQVAKDFNNVFKNPAIKAIIIQKHGQDFYKNLDKVIERILTGGSQQADITSLFSKLRSNVSVATIGLNIPSFLKQLTSFPAFMNSMPSKAYLKYQAEFFKDPMKHLKTILATDYAKNRMSSSYDRDVAEQIRRARGLLSGGMTSLSERFMFLTRMGDIGAIAMGGWPLYQYTYDQAIAAGKTEAQATKEANLAFSKASDRTQQSSNILQLGNFQGDRFFKLFTMFMTTPIQYQRTMAVSVIKAFQAANKNPNKKSDAIKSVVIFHVLLPQIFAAMSAGFVGFWSDDEEKREEFYNGQLRALILGNFNSYFIVGDILEGIINTVAGVDHPFQGDIESPVFKKMMTFGQDIQRLIQKGDMEAITKMIISAGELAGLPVKPVLRQASNVVDVVEGETGPVESVFKLLGFSDYALGRDSKNVTEQIQNLTDAVRP